MHLSSTLSLSLLLLFPTLTCANERNAGAFFGKTRKTQQHTQQQHAQAVEDAMNLAAKISEETQAKANTQTHRQTDTQQAPEGGFKFERRRLSLEEEQAAADSKKDSSMDPDMKIIKSIKAGSFDFFTDALPDMMKTVTKEEAGLIFENFKFMQSTKTWKAFVAEGGNMDDAEAVSAAQIQAVQEAGNILTQARPITHDADSVTKYTEEFVQNLKESDPEAPALFDRVRAGDPMAIGILQQKFADKYLGGIDLDLFQDNEWIEKARTNFFKNEDMVRLIGDEDILSILKNPELRLYKANEMGTADPSRLLSSLMGNYAKVEEVDGASVGVGAV